MLKKFLWLLKLFFILVCLLLWGFLVQLGGSILPTFVKQCKYHKTGEEFLNQKYGEKIKLQKERLPLTELNSGNYSTYKFSFKLREEEYSLLYYEEYDYFCDNRQAKELYQIISERIEQYLASSNDVNREGTGVPFLQLVHYDWGACPEWWLIDFIDRIDGFDEYKNKEERLYHSYYTGNNLEDFPIYLHLYYDNQSKLTKQEVETLFEEVVEGLEHIEVTCKKLTVFYRKNEQTDWKKCVITDKHEEIVIEMGD